jgi:hypothetical protein
MDASLEPDLESPQVWDFHSLDQSYLDTFEMFGLPSISIPLNHTYSSFDDSLTMEDAPLRLNCNFSEMDISNVFASELASGFENKSAIEIDLSCSGSSKSPIESESSISTLKGAAKSSSKEERTKKLDELFGQFQVSWPTNLGRNHRKVFGPEERRKVHRVRRVGACLRCKLLKRPVGCSIPSNNASGQCF